MTSKNHVTRSVVSWSQYLNSEWHYVIVTSHMFSESVAPNRKTKPNHNNNKTQKTRNTLPPQHNPQTPNNTTTTILI